MTRRLKDGFLVGLCLILFMSISANVVHAAAQNPGAQSMPMESDQMTNIPYFTLLNGMSSTLTLNNLEGLNPTKVTITIFNMKGTAQVLPPMTLGPASVTKINLADVIKGEDFESGNIQVAFRGIPMTVTCQVSVFSVDQRVSFESREADMMDFISSSTNGVLSLPQAGAEGFLAVTNTAKNRVTVQLMVGTKKENITLLPRETQLLNLNDELAQPAPVAALVKIQQNGLPGDIITTGFVLDLKDKYSSNFNMIDPATSRSSKLAGAYFRSGQADPSEGFPIGTVFKSPLLLANVSEVPVTAHVSVGYTVEEKLETTPIGSQGTSTVPAEQQSSGAGVGKFSDVALKDVTIAPGAVQRIELSGALSGAGLIQDAGVDIAYDAAPGTVIGQLTSVDQSGDYSFEVPIKDPSGMSETIESAYPWSIENGTNSVVHLKNTSDKSVSADLVLKFPDGTSYSPERVDLEPYQPFAIDIQKLKDSKKLDVLKQGFPADATHGLLFWHQETPYTMIGRAEETNVTEGTSSSFSCNSGCCDGYYTVNDFFFNPGSPLVAVSGSVSLSSEAQENYVNCHNIHYTNGTATAYSWSSNNTSVATVNSSGLVSAVGSGTATITGNFEYHVYYLDGNNVCQDLYPSTSFMDVATTTETTQVPTSLSVVSAVVIAITNISGCFTTDYGIATAITYQVLDQNNNPIASTAMEPQEKNLDDVVDGMNEGNSEPNWVDIGPTAYSGTSKYTNSSGQFLDAPFGTCGTPAFTSSFTQPISILLNGINYTVRTNYWTSSSSAPNSGAISNAVDVTLSH